MDLAIQLCSYLVGLPLQLLTIAAMLHGASKRYPLVFLYVLASFLTTVVEMPASVAYYYVRIYDPAKKVQAAENYTWWYWRDEALLEVLVFAVVISLIYYATSKLRPRRIVRFGLLAGAVLFAGISFLVQYHPPVSGISYGEWANAWTRDLKFCAAVLDLALWAMLIASREKDSNLLMLSCAVGIMLAGEAIGESVRNLANQHRSHALADVGGLLVLVSDLGFLYIWWRAFRAAKVPVPVTRSA